MLPCSCSPNETNKILSGSSNTAEIYDGFEPCVMHRFAFSSCVLSPTVKISKLHLWQVKCELAGDKCVLWLGSQIVKTHFKTLNFFIEGCLAQYKSSLFFFNEHMTN